MEETPQHIPLEPEDLLAREPAPPEVQKSPESRTPENATEAASDRPEAPALLSSLETVETTGGQPQAPLTDSKAGEQHGDPAELVEEDQSGASSELVETESAAEPVPMPVAEDRAPASSAEPESGLERVPGYLSVREAARIMGVSERSVYGYIESGKLPGARVGNIIVVIADAVYTYERKAPGRIRTTTPPWHMPPLMNPQFLTTITVRMHPGQGERLEDRLYALRAANRHRLPGTAARYIARSVQDPDEVEIVLVWRSVAMPSLDKREAALSAFYAEFADIIDWETALHKEGRVLLHA